MGSGNIALIRDIGSAGNARVGGNGGARENIAKKCGRQCQGGLIDET